MIFLKLKSLEDYEYSYLGSLWYSTLWIVPRDLDQVLIVSTVWTSSLFNTTVLNGGSVFNELRHELYSNSPQYSSDNRLFHLPEIASEFHCIRICIQKLNIRMMEIDRLWFRPYLYLDVWQYMPPSRQMWSNPTFVFHDIQVHIYISGHHHPPPLSARKSRYVFARCSACSAILGQFLIRCPKPPQ